MQGFNTNTELQGNNMAYRKVRAGHGGPLHSRTLENVELQATALELEWDMEKELEEPGVDRFQLEASECHPVGNSSDGADPDMESIQPSISPRGRFERLEEDTDYMTHFTRPLPKSQWRTFCPLTRYTLLGAGLFILGLILGRYTHVTPSQTSSPPPDNDLYQKILQDITAEKIQSHIRALNAVSTEDGELSRALYLFRQWTDLGLTNVYLANYSVLLSLPGSSPGTIIDKTSKKCYLPDGDACNPLNLETITSDQLFSFAAYSATGTLEGEMIDVQYGSTRDLSQVSASNQGTNRIALLKLGQAPLIYKLSLLADAGFVGVLTYVDPCDLPSQQSQEDKAFGITLNAGGDPSTPMEPSISGSYRELRKNLTSLLVQPIAASLARELLSGLPFERGIPCTRLSMSATPGRRNITLKIGTKAEYKTIYNVIGYLKGATNPDRYVLVGGRHGRWYQGNGAEWIGGAAVMTQIIASLTMQAKQGWQPDRTTLFCSWGGSEFGNIGSFEWGEENRVVLQSSAVAYISLHHPVRGKGVLQSVTSPSLLQLISDIHKKFLNCSRGSSCPGPRISSVQIPGDGTFFANQLAVPTAEFAFQDTGTTEKTSFLHEALFPDDSSAELLDPSSSLYETVAKATGETILHLVSDPVLPFYPLDVALDVQNKLNDGKMGADELLAKAASLRESSAFFQSEMMRPANDPKERDPSHVRMLNDVLQKLERSFTIAYPPPGFYRNILYGLDARAVQFSILKNADDMQSPSKLNQSLSLILNAINSAETLIRSGLDLFENDPNRTS
ncbi:inactive N-acetylated-alpha-linked acidic dipeptidase-like protein 2 isoform X1 [Brienomyrus brachyistius]|uniref:inactive N-acetylated-alpha-linked acidic dipeptidase-like protein 2 isoform X1 n=2 Tax=Brienomyrus brachyistius TaxID=42636 RepID=UPI0020B1DA10|nr:inactive N-acetylated-alpha-linked acidic dipeptidase-like protein 2 isoform X1 [Brienomyrus brachyistius]